MEVSMSTPSLEQVSEVLGVGRKIVFCLVECK